MRVSQLAHEIRNILQPVEYHVGMLDAKGSDEGVRQRALAVLTEQLRVFQNVLLNVSILDQPMEIRPRRFELSNCLKSIATQLHREPFAAGVDLSIPDTARPLKFQADEYWLPQAFEHLLRNALEAVAATPRRVVRIEADIVDENVRVLIHDSGRGLDPLVREKLCQPFVSTKAQAGAGLGLAVAQKIIEKHGGTLELAGSPGGSCVSVVLPQGVVI